VKLIRTSLAALVVVLAALHAWATGPILLANGTLTGSSAGYYTDLSGLQGYAENGTAKTLLGGLGSGIAWAWGNTFVAVPDRGPNAVSYDSLIDDTVTYIPRFHTITMDLELSQRSAHSFTRTPTLPFTLTPTLQATTLLYSADPLNYGSGEGLGVGPGAPSENGPNTFYFSGRSDNYDPNTTSADTLDARSDTESVRVASNGRSIYTSDEYGPYVYQWDRATGRRLRTFTLPDHLFVAKKYPVGTDEISNNTSGRTANKGMEGLAITPDGRTLVGMMQAALIQDANQGGKAKKLLRFVTIDIASGLTTHEYAYLLTTGSGVSDIVALNEHEFLVDERDGSGLGNGDSAVVKQAFKIDINGATDITELDGLTAAQYAVQKTLFLDIVAVLNANGITSDKIPAKLEGFALAGDVVYNGTTYHTLWVANDNDFLQDYGDQMNSNPNQFFVFGFTDDDLGGSKYIPQVQSVARP
jgi:Esterase-like activity of phytase